MVTAIGTCSLSALHSKSGFDRISLGRPILPISGSKLHPPDSLHAFRSKLKKRRTHPKVDSTIANKIFNHSRVPIQFRNIFDEWDRLCFPGDDFSVTVSGSCSDIRVATLNVGGINNDKLLFIAWYFQRLEIDVMFLQDTQMSALNSMYNHRDLKDILGHNIYVSSSGTHHTGLFSRIGGQTVIVGERWSKHVSRFKADESGMGVVAELELMTAIGRLLILGTYWPYDSKMEAGLMGGLEAWMASCTPPRPGTPMQYIKSKIERAMLKHLTNPNNACILAGDLNSCYHRDGSQVSCKLWANECGLVNGVADKILHDNLIFFTRFMGDHGTGFIDHILHNPRLLTLESFGSASHAGWSNCKIDHRPLYACFTIKGGRREPGAVSRRRLGRSLPSTKIDKNNCEQVSFLKERMSEFCATKAVDDISIDELDLLLEEITTIGPSIARSFNGRRSITCRMKCGWSPTVRALSAQLTCFIEARRRYWGYKGRKRWTRSQRLPGLRDLVGQWVKCVDGMNWSTDGTNVSREMVLNRTGRSPDHWLNTPSFEPDELKTEIIRLQVLLGSRKRHQYRLELSANSAAREEAIESGKIGKAIKSIVGKPSTTVELTWLRISDEGDMIMDPKEILRYLNDKFHDWHAGPADAISGIHVQQPDWHLLCSDRSKFDELVKEYGIPAPLLDHIWKAIRAKAALLDSIVDGMTLREKMEKVISEVPTLEEFRGAVRKAKGGVTSGMSGLTYDILNCWPDSAIEMAYNAICKIKESGRHPTQWKWKWISPIPKVAGDNSLENIRPISLVEILRKVWTGIRVSKIWRLVEKFGLLHPSQHGYRRKRGTDTMTVQLLDILEHARESHSDLALASWDIVRAFDSISRVLAMVSLHRIGVPVSDCEDIINIDEGGQVFVKCPHSTKVWQRKISSCPRGRSYAKVGKTTAPPFSAIRGIGQGDNHSPLTWILFEDIILCAMDSMQKDPFYIQKGACSVRVASDMCYADDLLTISGRLSGLQAKADIMSALALIFKLRFNTSKLRLFLCESGIYNRISVAPKLTIHEGHWSNTVELPLANDGEFKSLGFTHSVKGLGSQFDSALSYTSKVCKIVGSKYAKPKSKVLALNVHLFNKIAYVGKYGSWPLSMYDKLDIPVQALLRKITHNLPSHPNKLFYMRKADGGLQMKKLSDHCQLAKYALLHRSLLAEPATSESVNSLLLRSAKRMGTGHTGGRVTLMPCSNGPVLWIDSLVTWLKRFHLDLTRGGTACLGPAKPILDLIKDAPNLRLGVEKLAALSVVNCGDLVSADHHDPCWIKPAGIGAAWLGPFLVGIPPSQPITLRSGQLWKIAAASPITEGIIAEIVGVLNAVVKIRLWKLAGQQHNISAGATITLAEPSNAGRLVEVTPLDIFGNLRKPIRILASSPKWDKGKCTRTVLLHTRQLAPILPVPELTQPSWTEQVADMLRDLAPGTFDVFTDGSWTEAGGFMNRLFGYNMEEKASGGFCVMRADSMPSDGKIFAVHIVNDIEEILGSSMPMELLSIIAALQLVQKLPGLNKLYSDSESSLKLLSAPGRLTYWCRKANLALLKTGLALSRGCELAHVRSHVEKRKKDCSTWLPCEWGNYLADKIAADNQQALSTYDVMWLQVNISQILADIGYDD